MAEQVMGRRERKKAATRQGIADAAMRLFLERGYDKVSVRDVAEDADVSTTTLFKHFPCKEALVFDRDTEIDAELVAAVRERRPGDDVLAALRRHVMSAYVAFATHPERAAFTALVDGTPALRDYSERMWTRHTAALGAVIADEIGVAADDLASAALARFILDIPALARDRDDPRAAVETIFDLLAGGWSPTKDQTVGAVVRSGPDPEDGNVM